MTDRRCTNERWVRDLLVDGCLTHNDQYWCLCSTDLCNAGDFVTIRGTCIDRSISSFLDDSIQAMMIVPMIRARRAQSVSIPKMDSVASAHPGKKIASTVSGRSRLQKTLTNVFMFFVASNIGCSCKNGGRCVMSLGNYICECPYGYNGMNCETRTFRADLIRFVTHRSII